MTWHNKRPIVQIDPETYSVVTIFGSILEAANAMGVHESTIRRAVNEGGKSKGFYWDDAKEGEINESNSSNTH